MTTPAPPTASQTVRRILAAQPGASIGPDPLDTPPPAPPASDPPAPRKP